MNNENEPPARMQQQDCHGTKQAIKFAWPYSKVRYRHHFLRTMTDGYGILIVVNNLVHSLH